MSIIPQRNGISLLNTSLEPYPLHITSHTALAITVRAASMTKPDFYQEDII